MDIIVGVLSTRHRYNWARMVGIVGKYGRLCGRYILDMGEREERVGWYIGVLYRGGKLGGRYRWSMMVLVFTV